MGRWAQRKRTGGGGNAALVIVAAFPSESFDIQVFFSGQVDVADFNGSDFETEPNAHVGVSVAQNGVTSILVTFGAVVTAETAVVYSGSAPGIESPQTFEFL